MILDLTGVLDMIDVIKILVGWILHPLLNDRQRSIAWSNEVYYAFGGKSLQWPL